MGLLGMLALVVTTETFIIHRGTGLGAAQAWMWNSCGRAASRSSKDCQVVCLGDSQVKHGLMTNVLEDRLHLRTMNLAFSGCQAPASYFQLERILKAKAKPTAVVVDFYPVLLGHGLEENTYRWAELLSVPEAFDLARTAQDSSFFAWVMTGRLLPCVRFRLDMREIITSRLRGEQAPPTDRVHVFRRNTAKNRGTLVFEKNPTPWMTNDIPGWLNSAFLPDRVGNACNMRYVDRFLKLACEHKIPVFWVVPPDHPKFEASKDEAGINDRYTHLLNRAVAKFPNVVILDARHSAYPSGVFFDQSHLDRDGAATLTAQVANVIRGHLAGNLPSRFVNLPAYQPEDPKVPVEDTLQTFMVLGDAANRIKR